MVQKAVFEVAFPGWKNTVFDGFLLGGEVFVTAKIKSRTFGLHVNFDLIHPWMNKDKKAVTPTRCSLSRCDNFVLVGSIVDDKKKSLVSFPPVDIWKIFREEWGYEVSFEDSGWEGDFISFINMKNMKGELIPIFPSFEKSFRPYQAGFSHKLPDNLYGKISLIHGVLEAMARS